MLDDVRVYDVVLTPAEIAQLAAAGGGGGGGGSGNLRDEFNTDSFSNNDGTVSWNGDWIEVDDAGAGAGASRMRQHHQSCPIRRPFHCAFSGPERRHVAGGCIARLKKFPEHIGGDQHVALAAKIITDVDNIDPNFH